MPYVIKVLDRPAETLCDILKKGEYFFHFRAISDVAVSSKRHAPGPSLRAQRCFEAFCEVEENKLKVNERIFHRGRAIASELKLLSHKNSRCSKKYSVLLLAPRVEVLCDRRPSRALFFVPLLTQISF